MLLRFARWLAGEVDFHFYASAYVDLLRTVIWPAVVLVALGTLRRELASLVNRVSQFEDGEWKAHFAPEPKSHPTDMGLRAVTQFLYNYRYVWGKFGRDADVKSASAVRFSEKYEYGSLRYIDDCVRDAKSLFTETLPTPVVRKVGELVGFLDAIQPFQLGGEHLSAAVFHIPTFITLMASLNDEVERGVAANKIAQSAGR